MAGLSPNYRKRSYLLPKSGKPHWPELKPQVTSPKVRLNGHIKAEPVELRDESGNVLGVFSLQQAMEMAHEQSLDLIELNPNHRPSRCLLMDYGRFYYRYQSGTFPSQWLQ